MSDAAKRELKEETNLEGEPVLVQVEYLLIYDKKTNDLLEDKFFFFHKVEDPAGELSSNEENEHFWIPEDQMESQIVNPFESKEDFFEDIRILKSFDGNIKFIKIKVYSEKF